MSEKNKSMLSEIIFYQSEDSCGQIQVRLEDGSEWLTQRLLAKPFQVLVPTIDEHLGNIFDEQELTPAATIRRFRKVQNNHSVLSIQDVAHKQPTQDIL